MFGPFKKFKITELLGEGLNANVYKVEKYQSSLKEYKTFALKVLKRSEDLNHFKTEFESLLKADGKHLVKFRGWERHNLKPALLLEYIDGATLHSLITKDRLSATEASWVHQETLKGLEELKDSGLFHGDLSPRNIMITTGGDIKLIDFGLTNWRTQKIELTPEFAAKSVLNGEKPSFSSDKISLSRIFEKFGLNSNNELVENPTSLALKVQFIKNASAFMTEEVSKKGFNKSSKLPFLSKRILFACTFFSFITPVTALNYINVEHSILIRSSKWISVKSSLDSKWCYTPCSLKFTKTGLEKVYWKTKDRSGELKIYVDGKQKSQRLDLSKI
jgi:serine/threonine protein kinase